MIRAIIFSVFLWAVIPVSSDPMPVGEGTSLIWSSQLGPENVRGRTGISPDLIDRNRAGVIFFGGLVMQYAVTTDSSELSERDSPEVSSPFRLRALLLDASSGTILFQKDWRTRVHDSEVQATAGGVLIRTGGVIRVLSRDFTTTKMLGPLPGSQEVDEDRGVITRVSPTGNTIMVERRNQKQHTSELTVFDSNTLQPRQAWKQPFLLNYADSISDSSIARKYAQKILVADFGSANWKLVAETSGFCSGMNMPSFISNSEIAYGCNGLVVTSTDGRVLMRDDFPKGDSQSKLRSFARGGQFIAIAIETEEIKTHLFREPGVRITARRIVVYDLTQKKNILTINVTPLPQNIFSFALSEDGSKLAILNDRCLSMYRLPIGR